MSTVYKFANPHGVYFTSTATVQWVITNKFIDQKLNYIHTNPVMAGLVDEPEHYRYSSARDYAGNKGLLDIALIE